MNREDESYKMKNTRPIKPIEPATTITNEEKFLHIVIELPGVAEEKIRIDLENSSTMITIVANDDEKQYKKIIPIPCEVRFSKKRFSKGVLELILEKKQT